jgi:small subunit ribosomal protein S19e
MDNKKSGLVRLFYMTTAFDVPADKFISKLAENLKKDPNFTPPDWSKYIKTGIHREKPPVNNDWWYTRTAAVLRKIYINSPIGVKHVSQMFGGAVDRGSKPNRSWSGSRAIIRYTMKQLESAGYVKSIEGKGRVIQPAGQRLLDNIAYEVKKDVIDDIPGLAKY